MKYQENNNYPLSNNPIENSNYRSNNNYQENSNFENQLPQSPQTKFTPLSPVLNKEYY